MEGKGRNGIDRDICSHHVLVFLSVRSLASKEAVPAYFKVTYLLHNNELDTITRGNHNLRPLLVPSRDFIRRDSSI